MEENKLEKISENLPQKESKSIGQVAGGAFWSVVLPGLFYGRNAIVRAERREGKKPRPREEKEEGFCGITKDEVELTLDIAAIGAGISVAYVILSPTLALVTSGALIAKSAVAAPYLLYNGIGLGCGIYHDSKYLYARSKAIVCKAGQKALAPVRKAGGAVKKAYDVPADRFNPRTWGRGPNR
ncbi:MAG: hypothetical protein PHE27_05385 [Alphaproteobacteria bacterium]|nr:hypothetical protein [Alphaproteobacteria bacterium]